MTFIESVTRHAYRKLEIDVDNGFTEVPKFNSINQSINQVNCQYVRHGCLVAQARGLSLKRKTIKLSINKTI